MDKNEAKVQSAKTTAIEAATEQAAKNAATETAETKEKLVLMKFGDFIVIPTLYVTRDTFTTNRGSELGSYGVDVMFFGQKKRVSLKSRGSKTARSDSRDTYVYGLLDTMFEVIEKASFVIRLKKDYNGAFDGTVEYFAGYIEDENGEKRLVENFNLVTQKMSSESLIRSAINRLAIENDWDLPVL